MGYIKHFIIIIIIIMWPGVIEVKWKKPLSNEIYLEYLWPVEGLKSEECK